MGFDLEELGEGKKEIVIKIFLFGSCDTPVPVQLARHYSMGVKVDISGEPGYQDVTPPGSVVPISVVPERLNRV